MVVVTEVAIGCSPHLELAFYTHKEKEEQHLLNLAL